MARSASGVATLGRLDELKASGQLDRFAGAFARLDPPPAGTTRAVGPLLLVAHYLRRLGLVGLVDQVAPMRGRSLLTHGEVVAALVANRLCGPAPLYDVSSWASSAAVAELLGVPAGLLNDDRLARALEVVAPHGEDLRGRLLLRTVERCKVDASRLHLDLTAVRFAGSYEGSALVKKGWAADRTIGRQVKTLQACTPSGVSLYFRPHQGAQSELPAFMEAIEAFAASLPPGLVVVADSGLGYLENLCAVDSSKVALRRAAACRHWLGRAVLGRGAGRAEGVETPGVLLTARTAAPGGAPHDMEGAAPPLSRDSDDGVVHGFRVAYVHSSEEEASVEEARERALKKAEEALGRVAQRPGRPLLQDQKPGRRQGRPGPLGQGRRADERDDGRTGRQTDHHLSPQRGGGRRGRGARRPLRPGDQPPRPARAGASRP